MYVVIVMDISKMNVSPKKKPNGATPLMSPSDAEGKMSVGF